MSVTHLSRTQRLSGTGADYEKDEAAIGEMATKQMTQYSSAPSSLNNVIIMLILSMLLAASVCASQRVCDEDHCKSIITRCTEAGKCNCNVRENKWCVKDCIDCLDGDFGRCCGCVDRLCPRQVVETYSSHVGETIKNDQALFETLTETDDIHGRWAVFSYTTGFQIPHPELGQIEFAYRRHDNNRTDISHDPNLKKLKCTVAFINKHLGLDKCRQYCSSMGAIAHRWFHDGCCECVGENCMNYGIDKPKCNNSADDDDDHDDYNNDQNR